MSISIQEAHEQLTNIMTQPNVGDQEKRQQLFRLAKDIGASTRNPSNDSFAASQAELIQHILARFQMMGLVETHKQNSRMWKVALISAIVALISATASVFSAIASWVAVTKPPSP